MKIAFDRLHGRSAHAVGRQLLQSLCGGELPKIAIEPQGKPYFIHSSLHFSITHTDKHAFCCLSSDNVGIDAEEVDRPVSEALARKVLSPSEKCRYDMAADKKAALLRLWVLKEAYAKLLGKGLGDYLYRTDFDPDDPRVYIIDGCYVAILTHEHAEKGENYAV